METGFAFNLWWQWAPEDSVTNLPPAVVLESTWHIQPNLAFNFFSPTWQGQGSVGHFSCISILQLCASVQLIGNSSTWPLTQHLAEPPESSLWIRMQWISWQNFSLKEDKNVFEDDVENVKIMPQICYWPPWHGERLDWILFGKLKSTVICKDSISSHIQKEPYAKTGNQVGWRKEISTMRKIKSNGIKNNTAGL